MMKPRIGFLSLFIVLALATCAWGASTKAAPAKPPAKKPVTTSSKPILKSGSEGGPVTQLQKSLITLGYKIKADGYFGTSTAQSVMAFQKSAGVKADGVVGASTWDAITKAQTRATQKPVAKPAQPPNTYTVRAGDTLGSVAGKFKITEVDLAEANRLKEGQTLKIGQILSIPRVKPADPGTTVEKPPTSRQVVLTFDDSPDGTYLNEVLKILSQRNAKATLFLTTETLAGMGTVVKEAHALGHSLQTHGPRETEGKSAEQIAQSLNLAAQEIYSTAEAKPKFCRPFDANATPDYLVASRSTGHTIVMWSNIGAPSADELLNSSEAALFDGAVMRFSLGDPAVAEMLPAFLEHMRINDYTAVALESLLIRP